MIKDKDMPYTYILQCADGTYYTGWAAELAARLAAHNKGTGARYTRSRLPVCLVYWEYQPDQSQAQRREWEIKSLTRQEKEQLLGAGMLLYNQEGGIIMNIFDFALKMELDGEKYYRELAEGVKYNDLKTVLEGLATDEQRHYKIIQLIQKQTLNHIEADPSLSKTPNVFAINTNKDFVTGNSELIAKLKDEQIDIYRAALVKEKESVELYKKLKENAEKLEEKMIWEQLMHEEENHVELIDNIIEMLNHVNDWVEAAEFNHQDIY
ncbi:MAG TPA: ferritin family protein [Methylomusa anaerophila]|uniref:GIY-YIG nuclease superfamily protein n=1 Tax=Methylomusa anaerophila TaxID=1930071 RepID=A0A348AGI8_9FIRM|nr:GIY-YIG nuclease family protein [Methylomusa anaerophila]BBB90186.1 GIY-YIG nuclease superfamily protein [Methylomusa anaerophila]HML88088.1 ferritin family protein [Methylomusa anaerophila]